MSGLQCGIKMDDGLLRIGKNILQVAAIPYDEGCWYRSGLTEQEVLSRATDYVEHCGSMEVSVQATVLVSYIEELLAEEVIKKDEKNIMLRRWSQI